MRVSHVGQQQAQRAGSAACRQRKVPRHLPACPAGAWPCPAARQHPASLQGLGVQVPIFRWGAPCPAVEPVAILGGFDTSGAPAAAPAADSKTKKKKKKKSKTVRTADLT